MTHYRREAEAFNDSIRGSFEDVFVDFVNGSKSAGDAFKSFANSVVNEMLRSRRRRSRCRAFGDSSDGGWLALLGSAASAYFGGANTTDYRGTTLPNSLRGGAATGTNLVERDMATMLHKGEAVVPKAYNPAARGKGWGGGINVQITNNSSAQVAASEGDDGTLQLVIEAAAEQGAQRGYSRVMTDIRKGGPAGDAIRKTYGLSRTLPKRA